MGDVRRWRIDSTLSSVSVWTGREGVLSPVGHDLILDVPDFSGDVRLGEDGRAALSMELDPNLRVRCARDGERELPRPVSASDRRDIEKSVRKEVLNTRRYPKIRFNCTGPAPTESGATRTQLRGELEVVGRRRSVPVDVERVAGEGSLTFDARATFRQSDFGIKPYRALLGTLRVRDDLEVRARVVLQSVEGG